MISSLRGMNDILSEDYERFTYFLSVATRVAQRYGFHFIETPILEETALFKRSVGESSDIVGKEMYQFIDKGENDVCLRPEGTAGVVRAFIQKSLTVLVASTAFSIMELCFVMSDRKKGDLDSFISLALRVLGLRVFMKM